MLLSCGEEPDKNLQATLEQAYLLCFELLKGPTGGKERDMVNSVRVDDFRLKNEIIEQLSFDFK